MSTEVNQVAETIKLLKQYLFNLADELEAVDDSPRASDQRLEIRLTDKRIVSEVLKNRVSRHTARDAISRLEFGGLGIIQRTGKEGARVVLPSRNDIHEIVDVRLAIETFAALRVQHSAERRDYAKDVLRRIQEEMEALQKKFSKRSPDAAAANEFWECDSRFHEALCLCAGNEPAAVFVSLLRDKFRLFGSLNDKIIQRMPLVVRQHRAIISAITSKRPSATRTTKVVYDHLEGAREFLGHAGRSRR